LGPHKVQDAEPGRCDALSPAATHALLLDFDGTISPRDVGHALFNRFARDRAAWDALVARWNAGALGGRACLEEECRIARAGRGEVLAFCGEFSLDAAFAPLVARLRALGWDVAILSDGLDVYIEALLAREGLSDVPLLTNHATFGADGALVPEFPHFARGCGRCGTCKGAEVARRHALGQTVWFAGDGVSDRCAAPLADRLFARRDLLAFARARGIPATPFDSLADVAAALPGAALDRSVGPL
jgi:2,3-diketo-5-methylthio-1-phosphopentane phosphatase